MRRLSLGLIAFSFGCSATTADICGRLDECNALENISVNECTDNLDEALEEANDAERADFETLAGRCLELEVCRNFLECYGGDLVLRSLRGDATGIKADASNPCVAVLRWQCDSCILPDGASCDELIAEWRDADTCTGELAAAAPESLADPECP